MLDRFVDMTARRPSGWFARRMYSNSCNMLRNPCFYRSESFIEKNMEEALKNGITMEGILEATSVAGLVCGGSRFASASMVLEVAKRDTSR